MKRLTLVIVLLCVIGCESAVEQQHHEQMLAAVQINVITKSRYYFTIVLVNPSNRAVRAVKGKLHASDVFGDYLDYISIKVTDEILPGDSLAQRASYDGRNEILRGTALDDLTFEWEPETVVFSDGEKIGVQ